MKNQLYTITGILILIFCFTGRICGAELDSEILIKGKTTDNFEQVEEDNPFFSFIVRKMLMSYVKRKTKKHIRNRVVRYATNKTIDYGLKNAIEGTANNLSYDERNHVKYHWENRNEDVDHAHNCRKCRSICQRVVSKIDNSKKGKSNSVSKYHKGTKLNLSLTFQEPSNDILKEYISSSDAFSGYNISLEQNIGFVQFEGGYKFYKTTNDRYSLDSYTTRSLFLNTALTLPMIKAVSPYVGGGYMYSKITLEENDLKDNFDNAGLYYFGGLDIRISNHFYLTGRYSKTYKAEEFDRQILEGGIKFRW